MTMTEDTPPVTVRLDAELLAAVDRYRGELLAAGASPTECSRSEAIRQLVRLGLDAAAPGSP